MSDAEPSPSHGSSTDPQIHLSGAVLSDGTTRIVGAAHALDDGPRRVLVAIRDTGQASWAIGSGGPIQIQLVLRDPRTCDRVPMIIDSAMEITESGSYPIRIEIGGTTTEGVLDIRVQRK